MAKMFGVNPNAPPADPQVQALVDAAVRGDVSEIDRLLNAGVKVNEQAPGPLAYPPGAHGVGLLDPQQMPKVPMTPLIAAVAHKQRAAVERLLERGADPNQNHAVFGTPVHCATGMGEAETLQLLIDRGGDVNFANSRGQTPMQVVAASRAIQAQMEQAQAAIKAMGVKIPGLADRMSMSHLPFEGWQACEKILESHGAR
jgi:Ankyrin repeats (3 copies)